MTRVWWRHRHPVRIGAALAVVGALVQPVSALAYGTGGGGPPANVSGTFANHVLSPSLTQGDLNLTAQIPIPDPRLPAVGPSNSVGRPYTPPVPGSPCGTSYSAGVSMAPESNGFRRTTWTPANNYLAGKFGVYDPTKPAGGQYMLLSPTAVGDAPTWDGNVWLDTTGQNPLGTGELAFVQSSMGQDGAVIKYKLTGKFLVDSLGTAVCVIDFWQLQHSTPWCGPTQNIQWNLGCSTPRTATVPPPLPPCTVNCVKPVDQVINRDDVINAAKRIWTDGGTVVSSPHANMELVQLPATFTLQGQPIDTPDGYASIQVPVGGPNIGVVSYQVHSHYAGSDFYMDNLDSGGTQILCQGVTTCTTTWDTIGHYAIRVIDNFSVEYRWVYWFHYPDGVQYQDWQPFPGAGSSFQLCAQPATAPPPSCAPGINPVSVGQLEAIPVSPRRP